MYICICNAVTDKDIKHAIDNGANSIKDLSRQLNVGNCCGTCIDSAKEILNSTSTTNKRQILHMYRFKPAIA